MYSASSGPQETRDGSQPFDSQRLSHELLPVVLYCVGFGTVRDPRWFTTTRPTQTSHRSGFGVEDYTRLGQHSHDGGFLVRLRWPLRVFASGGVMNAGREIRGSPKEVSAGAEDTLFRYHLNYFTQFQLFNFRVACNG